MATALKHKLSYHRRLFLLLLVFSWTLVGCFILFQYGREKHFKAERLDAQLQLFNLRMLDAVNAGAPPDAFIARSGAPCEGVRVTLIDPAGHVVFDNSLDTLPGANHLDRPEVAEALARGTGYTIRRHSESTDRNYFYSAMRGDRYIVRSAVPYSVPLGEILAADREFLWFMLGVTLLMSVAGYFATRRLGQNITRLNEFAERAERGERIDDLPAFPHDELGEISSHIIRLYARLQKTTADRDREHALALHEEQEKIRIKKQLTNNINHELKTPVAAIQGYLETLLANPSLDAQRRTDFLEKSAAQTERLRRLLADISTITRMDEASQLIQKERVVLNDLIAEVTADMELKPADQRLRVNIDFPQQVEIVGSPSLLASIFRNLADNAAAYSGGRDIFIRLAEKNHLITQITELQLRRVCRFLRENPALRASIANVKINLSPLDLIHSESGSHLIRILGEYGLPCSCFQFEITETVATEYSASLTRVAESLQAAGIGLCLDDFGSGYANLNTVMQLPFSVIKLDRSLLFHICTDKNAALFYQSIVSAFCRLGYRIVAEGVETQEEMELLRSWNVDMIQGYYFSRPLPPDDLLRLLTGSAEMQAENQA